MRSRISQSADHMDSRSGNGQVTDGGSASTCRRVNAPHRRVDASTRRRIEASTLRCVDASMHRCVDALTRRRVDTSMCRQVDASMASCVDASTRRRVDASTRRRVDAPTGYLIRSLPHPFEVFHIGMSLHRCPDICADNLARPSFAPA